VYLKISWRCFVLIRFNANTRATNLRVYCYWSYSKQNSAAPQGKLNWFVLKWKASQSCSSFRLSNRECGKQTQPLYTILIAETRSTTTAFALSLQSNQINLLLVDSLSTKAFSANNPSRKCYVEWRECCRRPPRAPSTALVFGISPHWVLSRFWNLVLKREWDRNKPAISTRFKTRIQNKAYNSNGLKSKNFSPRPITTSSQCIVPSKLGAPMLIVRRCYWTCSKPSENQCNKPALVLCTSCI